RASTGPGPHPRPGPETFPASAARARGDPGDLVLPGRVPRPDLDLVVLADRRARDVIDERPAIGALPHLDHALETLPEGACGRRGDTALGVYQNEWPASPAFIRDAYHGGVGNPVIPEDGVLEFHAGDQLTTGGDDVVHTVHHVEVTPGRDAGHVAGT